MKNKALGYTKNQNKVFIEHSKLCNEETLFVAKDSGIVDRPPLYNPSICRGDTIETKRNSEGWRIYEKTTKKYIHDVIKVTFTEDDEEFRQAFFKSLHSVIRVGVDKQSPRIAANDRFVVIDLPLSVNSERLKEFLTSVENKVEKITYLRRAIE